MIVTDPYKEAFDEFDRKRDEVRQETHWGEQEDSPNHEFGYKTRRGSELFTVTDWGNIRTFIRTHFIPKTFVREEMKRILDKTPHNAYGFAVHEVFGKLSQALLGDEKV